MAFCCVTRWTRNRRGRELNDRVHGRILRLQQYMEPAPHWLIAIRFDTIERNGREQAISLKPLTMAIVRHSAYARPRLRRVLWRGRKAREFLFSPSTGNVLDQKFHSEWETR